MSEDKFVPKSRDEIKDEVVEKYGFDLETQEDIVEKLTDDLLQAQTGKSSAIEQKASYRDKAKAILEEAGLDPDKSFESGKPVKKIDNQSNKQGEDIDKSNTGNDSNFVTREESRLLDKGLSWSDIDELRAIAKGKGLDIEQAVDDPLFKAYLSAKDKDDIESKKDLPPSNRSAKPDSSGSGSNPVKDPDSFKAEWEKKRANIVANSGK